MFWYVILVITHKMCVILSNFPNKKSTLSNALSFIGVMSRQGRKNQLSSSVKYIPSHNVRVYDRISQNGFRDRKIKVVFGKKNSRF